MDIKIEKVGKKQWTVIKNNKTPYLQDAISKDLKLMMTFSSEGRAQLWIDSKFIIPITERLIWAESWQKAFLVAMKDDLHTNILITEDDDSTIKTKLTILEKNFKKWIGSAK